MTANSATDRETIMEAASLWFAQLDSGTADIDAFEAWRDADPRHQAAFARIAGVGFQLDKLKAMAPARATTASSEPKKATRRSVLAAVVGTGVLVGLAASLTLATSRVRASTAVGESRTVVLPNGGKLTLNTDSKVSWKFKGDRHEVWLERGEIALVMPGTVAPLFLHGGENVVKIAQGDFNARLRDRSLDFTVVKGLGVVGAAVDTPTNPRTDNLAYVTAGHAALIQSRSVHVRPVDADDLHFVSGWRQGELVFNGQTLGSAISEYNRYLPKKIIILDASLADIRLGGRFKTRDPADFLAALTTTFGIHVARDDSGTVMLSK